MRVALGVHSLVARKGVSLFVSAALLTNLLLPTAALAQETSAPLAGPQAPLGQSSNAPFAQPSFGGPYQIQSPMIRQLSPGGVQAPVPGQSAGIAPSSPTPAGKNLASYPCPAGFTPVSTLPYTSAPIIPMQSTNAPGTPGVMGGTGGTSGTGAPAQQTPGQPSSSDIAMQSTAAGLVATGQLGATPATAFPYMMGITSGASIGGAPSAGTTANAPSSGPSLSLPKSATPESGQRGKTPGQFPAPGFPGVECVPNEPLSPIEIAFEKFAPVELSPQVRQFGYSLFSSAGGGKGLSETLPVNSSYVLGPGDELTVYIWGRVESVLNLQVDRNGEIFIPNVGTIKVWGLTFPKAEELIRDQIGRVFTGFRTSITLGRLRTIRVWLIGEVGVPGALEVSSLSTLTSALFAAGGPTKQGSLRRIRLTRNNQVVTEFDFYDFLMQGDKSRDLRLEAGDTVFVPPIGPVAAAIGDFKRPAIYELKGETRAADLVEMAGGLAPSGYVPRLQIQRFSANTGREALDFNLMNFQQSGASNSNPILKDGDLVRAFPVDPRLYNVVVLEGFVRQPGYYEYRPGMRVSDLVTPTSAIPETYLNRAEIIRLKPDQSTEIISFNLRDAWAGKPEANLELQRLDRISIGSEYQPGASVVLSGFVRRPGRYAISEGERLSSVIERAGGFQPDAFLLGAVFTRESVRQLERAQVEKFVAVTNENLIAESAALAASYYGGGAGAQAALADVRTSLLRSLTSAITLGRLTIHLDEVSKLRGTPNDILLQNGDSLYVPQFPSSVLVIGAVRNSGSVLFKTDETVDYFIGRVGGARPEADLDQVYIVKADGSAVASFVKLRKIEPGDAVVVPFSLEGKILWTPFIKDLITIIAQAAIPIGVIGGLLKK